MTQLLDKDSLFLVLQHLTISEYSSVLRVCKMWHSMLLEQQDQLFHHFYKQYLASRIENTNNAHQCAKRYVKRVSKTNIWTKHQDSKQRCVKDKKNAFCKYLFHTYASEAHYMLKYTSDLFEGLELVRLMLQVPVSMEWKKQQLQRLEQVPCKGVQPFPKSPYSNKYYTEHVINFLKQVDTMEAHKPIFWLNLLFAASQMLDTDEPLRLVLNGMKKHGIQAPKQNVYNFLHDSKYAPVLRCLKQEDLLCKSKYASIIGTSLRVTPDLGPYWLNDVGMGFSIFDVATCIDNCPAMPVEQLEWFIDNARDNVTAYMSFRNCTLLTYVTNSRKIEDSHKLKLVKVIIDKTKKSAAYNYSQVLHNLRIKDEKIKMQNDPNIVISEAPMCALLCYLDNHIECAKYVISRFPIQALAIYYSPTKPFYICVLDKMKANADNRPHLNMLECLLQNKVSISAEVLQHYKNVFQSELYETVLAMRKYYAKK